MIMKLPFFDLFITLTVESGSAIRTREKKLKAGKAISAALTHKLLERSRALEMRLKRYEG